MMTLCYRCTADEWLFCLTKTQHLRRQWIETGALLFVGAYCLIPFFMLGMTDWSSLVLGALALALIAVAWVVPHFRLRHEAEVQAGIDRDTRVRVREDGFCFGDEEEPLAFAACRPLFFADMVVLRFANGSVLGIPRRVMNDSEWTALLVEMHEKESE